MNPQRKAGNIEIYEWPQPIAEILDISRNELVEVSTPEEATIILQSMQALLARFSELQEKK